MSRCTRVCSRTTSSGCTRTAGGSTSCAAARTFSAQRSTPMHRPSCIEAGATLVTSHPISIDPAEFAAAADDARAPRGGTADRAAPARVARRTRRPDGSVEEHRPRLSRLRALPRAASGVARPRSFLALLDPSRQDVPAYAAYLAAIEREVAAVNARFGVTAGLPVELEVADNFAQSVAAYKQYDVLLVNAVFDGLNLVSKEAPLVNGRDGVLVLSENAGAHEELGEWALTVNPFDLEGQARAIHEALTMPAGERRRRLDGIRAHVCGARSRRLGLRAARRPIASRLAGVRFGHGDDGSSGAGLVYRRRSSRSARFAGPIRTESAAGRRGGACRAGAVAGGGPLRAAALLRAPQEPCAAARRDRRLDRGRDGEAAHRGDRWGALHGRRPCARLAKTRRACLQTSASASTSSI